nr:hypothetical protein [Prevotella sp.]
MPGADTAVMAQDMRDGKHVGLHVQQEGSAGVSWRVHNLSKSNGK